jgi:hypothetical protein
VTAGGNVSVATGRDLALKGARIEADSADLDIGRNLTIESRLDTAEGSNQSSGYSAGVSVGIGLGADGAGPTFGASASVNGAKGSNSSAWVNAPSGIVTDNALNADVGETTSITGGVIASRSGDLTLATERLETADIDLHRKGRQVSGSVGVSIGSNPEGKSKPGITVEGAYSNSETEGVARATIGEGEITVRDGDGDGIKAADLEAEADAAEAEGDTARAEALRTEADREAAEDTTATETQLSNLNRDPDAVVEVTSQKQEAFELYVSDTAVRAVQKSLKEATAPGGFIDKYLLGRELSEEERGNINAGLAALGEGGRFGGCGQKQGYNQFNPLNWLITPAHAQEFDCTIIRADGSVLSLGIKTYAECSDAIYAYLNSLSREERDTIVFAAGYASGLDLVGEGGDRNASQLALIDALYVLDNDIPGVNYHPYGDGLSQAYADRAAMDANVRAVLGNDDLTLGQKDQRLREYGTSVRDIFMLAALGAIPGVKVKTKTKTKTKTKSQNVAGSGAPQTENIVPKRTVDDIWGNNRTVVENVTTRGTSIERIPGGTRAQADADFDALKLSNVRTIGTDRRMGTLADGTNVIVRPSRDGRPTIEFQRTTDAGNVRTTREIRYGD